MHSSLIWCSFVHKCRNNCYKILFSVWPIQKNLKTLILILALEWACVKNRKRVPKYSQLTLDRSRFLLIMPLAVQLQPALHYIMGLYYFWSFKMRWPAWNSSGNSLEYEGLSLKKCWTASWHHSTLNIITFSIFEPTSSVVKYLDQTWSLITLPLENIVSGADKKIKVVTSWANAKNDYFTHNCQRCHYHWKSRSQFYYRGSPTYTKITKTVSTNTFFGLCKCKWGN